MTSSGGEADALAAAKIELQQTIATARVMLDRRRATPVHTPEQRDELQRDALSGSLGKDMQRLAQHIENGEETWGDVFEGIAPHGALFEGHLTRMSEEHAEEIRVAIEEDDEFDPLAADPELA